MDTDDEIEFECPVEHTSVLSCFDAKGQVVIEKYVVRRREFDDKMLAMLDLDGTNNESNEVNDDGEQRNRPPRVRSCKRKDRGKVCDDGKIHVVSPAVSIWYMTYVNTPMTDNNDFQTEFRSRFRIPFIAFQELCTELKACTMFERWGRADATGVPAIPIELLLLGALRILSRDAKLDDLTEYSAIANETHRQFFHVFLLYGSTILYNKHVKTPVTKEELMPHLQHYARKGFHGAVGSMDGTHIASKRISNAMKQLHTGYKLKHPSRGYNMTVNNQRQILHTTTGAPARWNDITLSEQDVFYTRVKSGEIGSDIEFELFYFDDVKRQVSKQKYSGVWFIVDNGYKKNSCAIPPYKNPTYTDQYAWSEWLESTRKDVECTFGILKGRFLIFESPIRFHGIGVIDKIWLTCCALHNLLLSIDTADDDDNGDAVKNYLGLPDASTMKYISSPCDFADDNEHDDPTYKNGCGFTIPVKKLNFDTFRSRLVRHYTICKCNGLATWNKVD